MDQFIAKHSDKITGVVSGFDRLVMRGTLRVLYCVDGMMQYLRTHKVLLKDFGSYAQRMSSRLKLASLGAARRQGRPIRYLGAATISKEQTAREIAQQDRIERGLICVLKTLEPCISYDIYRNAGTRMLDLVQRHRRCLHLYHYWIDPLFGFMSARIQTWFPFAIQICLNGREWLARQMDRAGLRYQRADNCFLQIEDYAAARKLICQQLRTEWRKRLDRIAWQLNPLHEDMFRKFRVNYYWSAYQTEWATDIVFAGNELQRLFPMLVRHGVLRFDGAQVMRFLHERSRWSPSHDTTSDLRKWSEGVRLKHWHNLNSIKVYDKADGHVLRVETTINQARVFRAYRPREGDPQGPKQWRILRKSVADLYRRAELSQKANERYLNALAAAEDGTRLEELLRPVLRRTRYGGKPVRALEPFAGDAALLRAIGRGEFTIDGLRNRDLQSLLFTTTTRSKPEQRRRSALVSRKLRLLRAHHLIAKVPRTHRYQLTQLGMSVVTAVLAASNTPITNLCKNAA